MTIHTPIIATSAVYNDYLTAARKNLDALLRLTQALRDPEFEREAQRMLDCFDSAAEDALHMIAVAETNCIAAFESTIASAEKAVGGVAGRREAA